MFIGDIKGMVSKAGLGENDFDYRIDGEHIVARYKKNITLSKSNLGNLANANISFSVCISKEDGLELWF